MIGQTISHYKILEKLGEGGMGVVYKAEDTKLKRHVALKFLPPELTRDADAKERFIQEARAASALDHPNICTIHEIDETGDGRMFMSMAAYTGETLKEKLANGPLPIEEAVKIAVQIARGLSKAHSQEIIHRDIKPANVFITDDDHVRIFDFGLAKLVGQVGLTKLGTTVGTVAYMSPEQAKGEDVDGRTDIWSLGVLLYEMLTGRLPFRGEHEQAVIYSIVNQDPEPPTGLRVGIPRELERIVEKLLVKDRTERYERADEVLADLRSLQQAMTQRVTGEHAAAKRKTPVGRVFIACLVIVVAALAVWRVYFAAQKAEAIDSIAVLPLDNLSGDPEQEYFADGMTEALIADLAKIRALKVISRTSVMRYKGTDKALPQIARELDVDAILEGSVLRAGDRVRITAQLIEARTDRHLWSENYNMDMDDILKLQSEVARAVADEIRIQLTPQETATMAETRTVDPEAHEAYLRARYHWAKRTEEDLKKSVYYLDRAIEKDPDYALAYAGLADAYIVQAGWGFLAPKDAYPRAEALASKALEIDDRLAEAYSVLASVALVYNHEWDEGLRLHRKVVELNPNYATGHQWYAGRLSDAGRHDEALAEIEKALALDPLNLIVNANVGDLLYKARRYDESIEQCKKTLDMDHTFVFAHYVLWRAFLKMGMYDEAVKHIEKASSLVSSQEQEATLDQRYRKSGIEGVFRWVIDRGDRLTNQPYNNPYYLALAHAALGERDEAFELLEACYETRSGLIISIGVDPSLDPLRSDPRFDDLLRRVGLAE
jgi:TolB-like protein/tRNA A-37 threonylcarbamoyl transferase component Bud32